MFFGDLERTFFLFPWLLRGRLAARVLFDSGALLSLDYHIHLIDLVLGLSDLFLSFDNLFNDFLSEALLLNLDHFLTYCTEIE